MKKLTIQHNHGVIVLEDAELVKDSSGWQVAKGICTGGGVTNRLFGETSYRAFPVGVLTEYPCHRAPWFSDYDKDYWEASVVSCG